MRYNLDNALHDWLQANLQQISTIMKPFTNLMQKMGDQITKNIDHQMDNMIDKLGPMSSTKSGVQKELVSIPLNNALSQSQGNVRVLNCPLGANGLGTLGT